VFSVNGFTTVFLLSAGNDEQLLVSRDLPREFEALSWNLFFYKSSELTVRVVLN
jgi:hypothetical protein